MAYFSATGTGGGSSGNEPVLLWTNPSPTTIFSPQDVTLDLSDYSAIMIENKPTREVAEYIKSIFEKISNTQYMGSKSSNYGGVIRQFNIYDDKISFGYGYYGTSASAYVCIPTRIWGYKKINFPS